MCPSYSTKTAFGPDVAVQLSLVRGFGVLVGYSFASRSESGSFDASYKSWGGSIDLLLGLNKNALELNMPALSPGGTALRAASRLVDPGGFGVKGRTGGRPRSTFAAEQFQRRSITPFTRINQLILIPRG